MTYTLPDLAYDYGALEPHYSGHALELHHTKHHAAYVKDLNRVLDRLGEARARERPSATVGLEKSPRSTCRATCSIRSSGRT